MQTTGLSPKLIVAVLTTVLTYILGQALLDIPAVWEVAGQAVLVALATYAAPPGDVQPKP